MSMRPGRYPKENFDLLGKTFEEFAPGKTYIIVEHLDLADLNESGVEATSDGVIRASVCDDEKGTNAIPVYEVLLQNDEQEEARDALDFVSQWASGFLVGARFSGNNLGLKIKPTKHLRPPKRQKPRE